jgi:hypothetical protein
VKYGENSPVLPRLEGRLQVQIARARTLHVRSSCRNIQGGLTKPITYVRGSYLNPSTTSNIHDTYTQELGSFSSAYAMKETWRQHAGSLLRGEGAPWGATPEDTFESFISIAAEMLHRTDILRKLDSGSECTVRVPGEVLRVGAA